MWNVSWRHLESLKVECLTCLIVVHATEEAHWTDPLEVWSFCTFFPLTSSNEPVYQHFRVSTSDQLRSFFFRSAVWTLQLESIPKGSQRHIFRRGHESRSPWCQRNPCDEMNECWVHCRIIYIHIYIHICIHSYFRTYIHIYVLSISISISIFISIYHEFIQSGYDFANSSTSRRRRRGRGRGHSAHTAWFKWIPTIWSVRSCSILVWIDVLTTKPKFDFMTQAKWLVTICIAVETLRTLVLTWVRIDAEKKWLNPWPMIVV